MTTAFHLTDADPRDIAGLEERWNAALSAAPYRAMSFADFVRQPAEKRRLLIGTDERAPVLPFLIGDHRHRFTFAERRLGSLPVRGLSLVNAWLAEYQTEAEVAAALHYVLMTGRCDALRIGEIPQESLLRRALGKLAWPARSVALARKDSMRWAIDLPDSYETYLSGLSASTRQSQRRKMRKLGREHAVDLEIVTTTAQVPRFLAEGEKISRMTYQWNVGQRLIDDAVTRETFTRLAKEGRLRCYLMSLDGVPRAFMRGQIDGEIYVYDTPGFDPAYGRTSIGTVLLLRAIEDLIENTGARVFDFGTGGDATGYKSSFGNRSVRAKSYIVVRMDRPRGAAIRLGQAVLNRTKNGLDRVARNEELRRVIRRRIRRYGDD